MRSITELSEEKIQLSLREHMSRLDTDVASMFAQSAAAGHLMSGGTVKKVMALTKSSYLDFAEHMSEQCTWAIKATWIVRKNLIDFLKMQAEFYLEQLHKHALSHLRKATDLARCPEQYEQRMLEVAQYGQEAKDFVLIEIDSSARESRKRLTAIVWEGLGRLLRAVFGWFKSA